MITNGSMQALNLLFDLLLRPGDEALVEAPTFHYTLASLRSRGVHLRGMPVKVDGIDPDGLMTHLSRGGRPVLAVVTPNCQNPTGRVMPSAHRQRLARIAAEWDLFLIEDDPYRDLVFDGSALRSVQDFDRASRVIYVSSFSKVIAPGLRCGYIIAPSSMTEEIAGIADLSYLSPGVFSQSIIYQYCTSGRSEEWLGKMRQTLRQRRDTLVSAIGEEMPDARFSKPDGGYFVWLELGGVDVHSLAGTAMTRGVAVTPGPVFMVDGGDNAVRLSYAPLDCDQISEGVARLAAAIRDLSARGVRACPVGS